MAARNKPYEQFGAFLLFKKLETDSLGDLWRAGRMDAAQGNAQLGPTFALRRLTGGSREAMAANATAVSQILPRISGASFVKEQQAGVQDGIPYLAWDYAGGRSLRHIIDRARGGKDAQPNPLPIDQAIVIAEKVALSLNTMADLRDTTGQRLCHGALIPQFVWISDDGEIRVAAQQFGTAMMASLADPKVAADVGRYFAPEYRTSGQPQKHTDVYSMGAILFLLVTGQEPPDAATASAFGSAVRAAKTMTGAPIPDDIRVILDKSFNLDPSMRYGSIGDMKQAISALAHGGKYSATTFNLAFYLNSLLKHEMESEAADREKEAKVNVAPYLETPKAAPIAAAAAAEPVPAFLSEEPKRRSKAPLAIAAVVAVGIVGAGAYLMIGKMSTQPPAKQVVAAQTTSAPVPPRVISEPIAVTPAGTTTTTTTAVTATAATTDTASQQKAFEEAVRRKMHEEMMKLQNEYMEQLKKQQAKNAPISTAPPVQAQAESRPQPQPQHEERPAITAAQLDQARRQEQQVAEPRTAAPQPVQQTQTTAPQPQVSTAAPAPQAAASTVRQGDVIDVGSLDVVPHITRVVKPQYPPLAARQRISATVFLTVLISEQGEVLDVKVLRGDARFGINDAAVRAMRAMRFSPPMKDGKAVRTWFPQTIDFKP